MTIPDHTPHPDDTTEDSTLTLDDGDIYVRQDGPRDAPTLVLVHGNASSIRSWDELVPMLARSHRVVRLDLLGHGRSAKPEGASYAITAHAHRVGVALDRLDVTGTLVVGHSTGGAVATALTEQRPDLVTALALINTGPRLDAFIAQESAPISASQWPPTDEQIRQFASTGFSRADYRIPQPFVDDIRGMTFHTLTATMQASTAYLEQQALPDRLTDLGTPLLVIFGEEDRRWRSSSAADYRVVPGARIEVLPGVGHSPILEDPPPTAALLQDFAAIHAAPAT